VATAVVTGALGLVAFWVTGLPNAFFWGFAMAVLSFIQGLGAPLVWVPAAVYLFATGSPAAGVGMLAWGVLVISSVDNLVKPMIIGETSALHPLMAFVGVLGGLAAFGIMGFLLGPLVLSLLAVVFRAFEGEELGDLIGDDALAEEAEGGSAG
jgi:predicted PurR-regulated permease PerM